MNWRKSTYSGGGEGNTCVEIAESDTHIAIRDSKAPTRATLTLTVPSFAVFVEGVKRQSRSGA
ncbi:DUF397 domain-containing protein [Streptomyces sp. ARC32]